MRDRSAVTLIEIIVLLAIIGALIALLLPAIAAARANARSIMCQNHLRQLGTAVHHHLATKTIIPGDWANELLPELERSDLQAYDVETRGNTAMPILLCPSDSNTTLPNGHQASSYGLNIYLADLPFAGITDGSSHTALFGEVSTVPYGDWTCSREFTGIPHLGHHGHGAHVAFCDGHVRFMSPVDDDVNLQLLVPNDGMMLDGWAYPD